MCNGKLLQRFGFATVNAQLLCFQLTLEWTEEAGQRASGILMQDVDLANRKFKKSNPCRALKGILKS